MAAWIGLVPRQNSTGGKERLGQRPRNGKNRKCQPETVIAQRANQQPDGTQKYRQRYQHGVAYLRAFDSGKKQPVELK